MDKDYRDFNTAKKIRIATAVVLILCAIAASIAWAVLTGSINVEGNKLQLGQVQVEVGYYDKSNNQRIYGHKDAAGNLTADESMIDFDERSASIAPRSTVEYTEYDQKIDYARRYPIPYYSFSGFNMGAARNFYVENKSGIDCYYRIYFEPIKDAEDDKIHPPYILGDHLCVSIWKIIGYDGYGKPYYGTYTDEYHDTYKIYDNTDPRVTPIVKNVPANEFSIETNPSLGTTGFGEWTASDSKWIDYIPEAEGNQLAGLIKASGTEGAKIDLHLELTYDDKAASKTIRIDEIEKGVKEGTIPPDEKYRYNQYRFNICVEAVQAKNQNQNNIQF